MIEKMSNLRFASSADIFVEAKRVLLYYGVKLAPHVIVRSEGVYIHTADGYKVLDWTSGQMALILGHGHPEIVETIVYHASHLDHLLSSNISPPVVALATELVDLLPPGLDRAMFLSTGGESCEAAIKMAKVYTGKYEIVALGSSWHGMIGASVAAQYAGGRKGFGPLIPGNFSLPSPNPYRSVFRKPDASYDWQAELDYGWNLIDQNSTGSLAAVIAEPILSSGGMLTLPPGYLRALKTHCERRGMLLILDEAQTAFGRCGGMFAFQDESIVPDILTLSKTLGGGLPLSAVITSNEIATHCEQMNFLFCTTHVNDPLPAAVGHKIIQIVIRDDLCARAKTMGEKLHMKLRELQSRYGCVGDIRGRGLLAGIEIVADPVTKVPAPDLGHALAQSMFRLGLAINLTIGGSGSILRIAPPIIMTEEELESGLKILEESFSFTEGTLPHVRAEDRLHLKSLL